jgi:hypothetical protein
VAEAGEGVSPFGPLLSTCPVTCLRAVSAFWETAESVPPLALVDELHPAAARVMAAAAARKTVLRIMVFSSPVGEGKVVLDRGALRGRALSGRDRW